MKPKSEMTPVISTISSSTAFGTDAAASEKSSATRSASEYKGLLEYAQMQRTPCGMRHAQKRRHVVGRIGRAGGQEQRDTAVEGHRRQILESVVTQISLVDVRIDGMRVKRDQQGMAVRSTTPPGANGITSRIGLFGKACAPALLANTKSNYPEWRAMALRLIQSSHSARPCVQAGSTVGTS